MTTLDDLMAAQQKLLDATKAVADATTKVEETYVAHDAAVTALLQQNTALKNAIDALKATK